LDSVKHVLSSEGKAMFDSRTNSLIVTDIPVQFDAIERIIALLDSPIPQVLIEVEMLDVAKSVIDNIGVNMSKSLIQYTGSGVTTTAPGFLFNPKYAVELGDLEAAPSFQYGTLSSSIFTALFDYLTTDSKTKFLARPRIMSLSNETAEIKITTNEAIGQNTVTVASEGEATTTVEAERFQTGVTLRVTPQVDPVSGYVTMIVVPTVAEAKAGATFNDVTYKDPEIRTSSSTLMVKNGETIVVGGLIKNKDELTIKKMPVLGDLPIIGAAFRHKDRTVEERELLVFLTPRVVGYDNAATLAKGDAAFPQASSTVEYREQATPVSHKDKVDDMLERWE
jgi:type II secretory pathway component GspD/PulD (secretin)